MIKITRKLTNRLTSIALLAMTSCISQVQASGEQFYFVGMTAPVGSMSQTGASNNAAYLRWDAVEGSLPVDVAKFVIKRDGSDLIELSATQIMSVGDINALYSQPENTRRRAEMINWLDLADDDDAAIDTSNYHTAIAAKLTPNEDGRFWAMFASRTDFNIAVVRHRGFVDTTATGVHSYELVAHNSDSSSTRSLGSVQVDVTTVNILPAAGGFEQVSRISNAVPSLIASSAGIGRCDLIADRFKDHGTVALNWSPAAIGANSTDRYASILLTAGFDIYRTEDALAEGESIPTKNIRSLAQLQPHAQDGTVTIPGLVKVNDVPIQVAATQLPDVTSPFFQPAFYQYLEARTDLFAQGLKPGDTHAYYLVARDITGNYGQTSAIEVTVPNLNPPAAPWRIDTVINPVDNTFTLTWDHVDVPNYHRSHEFGRRYCNLESARFDKELRFVDEGEECIPGRDVAINLNIESYIVYRFDTSEAAGAFTDTDGDGRSDFIERLYDDDGNAGTDPVFHEDVIGSACDVSDFPAPGDFLGSKLVIAAQNHQADIVPATEVFSMPSGRKVLQFNDVVPVTGAGTVYWYRVASRDFNGNVSSLSAPVRALFPKTNRPLRGALSNAQLGTQSCSYQVNSTGTSSSIPFASDATSSSDAASVIFSCGTDARYTADIDTALPEQLCRTLDVECGTKNLVTTYLGESGIPLATDQNPQPWASCPDEAKTELVKNCDANIVDPATPGSVVTEDLYIYGVIIPADQCLNLDRTIGGQSVRFKTICDAGSGPILVSPLPTMGDQLCLSISLQSVDNEVSVSQKLPCVTVDNDSIPLPQAPRVLSVNLVSVSNQAQIQLMPPEQPLAGSIVEWHWRNPARTFDQTRFSDFFPHAQMMSTDGALSITLDLNAEQAGADWQEEWCVRARTVAKANSGSPRTGLSPWSNWHCETRRPAAAATAPTYLPWPHVDLPPVLRNTIFTRYLKTDQMVVLRLSDDPVYFPSSSCAVTNILTCDGTLTGGLCIPDAKKGSVTNEQTASCVEFCPVVDAAVSAGLGFVVYRQRASNIGDATTYTDYVQVSPLIENVSCDTQYQPSGAAPDVSLLDPYIMFAEFTSGGSLWVGTRAVYRDQYPFIKNQNYRYQIVYFDSKGEINGYRETNWVLID